MDHPENRRDQEWKLGGEPLGGSWDIGGSASEGPASEGPTSERVASQVGAVARSLPSRKASQTEYRSNKEGPGRYDFDLPMFACANDDFPHQSPWREEQSDGFPWREWIVGMVVLIAGFTVFVRINSPLRPNSMVYPLSGREITSDYGPRIHPIKHSRRFHAGVDLRGEEGDEIMAVSDGRVLYASRLGGYGNLITVLHSGGVTTHYAHCKEIYVGLGDAVQAGQVIGSVGRTGLATAPHLHLEVRVLGVPTDPKKLLPDLTGVSL